MVVDGEWGLHDTAWNRCLAKCTDNSELLGIHWSGGSGESACCLSNRIALFTSFSRLSDKSFQGADFREPTVLGSATVLEVHVDLTTPRIPLFDYDQALCQLANQLNPSSGSEKLILILQVEEELPDPAAFLPRFSKFGILEIEVMGL